MVISSIDLKDGKVVQLKQGKELVLQFDNPDEFIENFDFYGETAVIDLDAALRNTKADGTTANTGILKSLLRKGNIRVGGGIRDAKKARELISLGAEKVIVGSAAFNSGEGCEPGINRDFLESFSKAVVSSDIWVKGREKRVQK